MKLKNTYITVASAVLVILAGLALTLCFAPSDRERSVLYFHSYDSENLCSEVRYLPTDTHKDRETLYIEELLLGPMTNRYKRLFSDGTLLEFCTKNADTIYVGLSKEALAFTPETENFEESVRVLKWNIVKKFTKINTVKVYIDGKSVFDE